jgi:hypothetical protein
MLNKILNKKTKLKTFNVTLNDLREFYYK